MVTYAGTGVSTSDPSAASSLGCGSLANGERCSFLAGAGTDLASKGLVSCWLQTACPAVVASEEATEADAVAGIWLLLRYSEPLLAGHLAG